VESANEGLDDHLDPDPERAPLEDEHAVCEPINGIVARAG